MKRFSLAVVIIHHSSKIPLQKVNTVGRRPVTLTRHFVTWNENGRTESSKIFCLKYCEIDLWYNVKNKIVASLVCLGCKTKHNVCPSYLLLACVWICCSCFVLKIDRFFRVCVIICLCVSILFFFFGLWTFVLSLFFVVLGRICCSSLSVTSGPMWTVVFVRLAVLRWMSCANFYTNFLSYLHKGTIDFNHSVPLQWPWPWLELTRSVESKTLWLHFLAHFSTDQDKIWCCAVATRIKYPDTTFEWNLLKQRK